VNQIFAASCGKPAVTDTVAAARKRWMTIAAIALASTSPVLAQSPEMQQKLAVVKETVAQNKQKLQQYQWIETTQLTLKGDPKPPTQDSCQYGADGQVQKTPIGAPPPPPSGGRLKKRIIEKKTEEMKEYLSSVKALLSEYVPPDPQKMQQAYEAGNFSLSPVGDIRNFIFKNYAQSGDQMIISFDPSKLAVISLTVNTYMGETKDPVTLAVQMALLPDGTSHVQQTVLNVVAKEVVVTTTNSNYQKLGGQ
jgi:hypothetical protein